MGYTHYWNRPQQIDPTTFNNIGNDLQKLLPALEAAEVSLANLRGREDAEIGPEFIGFNGVALCGHEQNPNVRLPWPADDAHGIGSNHGICGVLPYRTCNGDCSYESVWFERVSTEHDQDGTVGGFCKTNFRPYDLAVMAFLLIVQHHLSKSFTVQTDGTECHWAEAFALCQAELGYGAGYHFAAGKLHSYQEALCG